MEGSFPKTKKIKIKEQVDTEGPIGVEQEPRVESRSMPCGQRQEMEAARILRQSEMKP